MTLRVLLVDDHPLVRDGLRARLEQVPDLQVVAEAADGLGALAACADHAPDLILLDFALRDETGVDVARALLAQYPQLRLLLLSMHDNPAYVAEAQRAGASAYLLKDQPASAIVEALRHVAAGGEVWPQRGGDTPALTPREREVLGLVAEGLSCKQIGERLGMGVRTVETHRTHLRRKLALDSPAALLRYAMDGRWR